MNVFYYKSGFRWSVPFKLDPKKNYRLNDTCNLKKYNIYLNITIF